MIPSTNIIDSSNLLLIDYNLIIPLITMLFLMFNPIFNTFKMNYLKKIIFIVLALQVSLIVFRVVKPEYYNEIYFNYYNYLIIVFFFFVVINRYFDFNISQELFILKVKVQYYLFFKKSKSILKALNLIFNWIKNNTSQIENDRKETFKLIEKCIDKLIANEYLLSNFENRIDLSSLFEVLRKSYKSIKFDESFTLSYFDLVTKIIRIHFANGNIDISTNYIDLLTENIFQFELTRNDEDRQLKFLRAFFDTIVKENEIEIIEKYLKNIKNEFIKFDFNIKTLPFILIFQELTEIVIKNFNNFNKEFSNDYIAFIVSELVQKTENDKIHVFRNTMLGNLARSFIEVDEFLNFLGMILFTNKEIFLQDTSLVFVLNKFLDERLENDKHDSISFGKLFMLKNTILMEIENSFNYVINFDVLINYLIYLISKLDDKLELVRFTNLIKTINSNKEFQVSFLFELNRYTNEKTFENSILIFYHVITRIYDPSTISNHTHFLALIDVYLETYIKKKSINQKYKLKLDDIENIKDLLNEINTNFSINFTDKLVEIVGEYLDNAIIGKDIFDFLFDLALTEIESNNGATVKIISNKFGWFIFGSINNLDDSGYEISYLKKVLKKVMEFYKFVHKHLGDDVALFVGTLFIVNGIYLDYASYKHQNKKNYIIIREYYSSLIKELDNDIRVKLIESFDIRKFSIAKYITGENEETLTRFAQSFLEKIER